MGTHPIFESDFDCLTVYTTNRVAKKFGGVSCAPIMLLLTILLGVVVNAQDFALVKVTPNDGTNDAFKFCVGYGQDYGYKTELPSDPSHSDLTFHFSDLSAQPSLALCPDFSDTASLGPLISTDSVALVNRGNCTFQEKATTLKEQFSGKGLITINNEDFIFSPAPNDTAADDLSMFVAIMAKSSFADLSAFAARHNGLENVRGALYALPHESKFDPTLIAVWLLAMVCVTVGTLLSAQGISRGPSGADRSGSLESKVIIEDGEENGEEHQEITVKTGAIWLCVTTGWLCLLYMLYDYLVFIMIGIFCFCGALAIGHVLYCTILVRFSCTSRYTLNHRAASWGRFDCLRHYPIAALVLYACCFAFTITWFVNRHSPWGWILQDIIGFFFCIYTIGELRLPNFKMLTFLLIGFAIYDLFMVYVTPYLTPSKESVMVYVATGGDNPEKMPFLFLMPHLRQSDFIDLCHQTRGFSMLGFGDLIIPGLLGGYAIYFDIFNEHKRFYYWWSFIISYGAGLLMTFAALFLMNSGQPALVFIVPSCLTALLLCATCRGEMSHFWNGPKMKESLN